MKSDNEPFNHPLCVLLGFCPTTAFAIATSKNKNQQNLNSFLPASHFATEFASVRVLDSFQSTAVASPVRPAQRRFKISILQQFSTGRGVQPDVEQHEDEDQLFVPILHSKRKSCWLKMCSSDESLKSDQKQCVWRCLVCMCVCVSWNKCKKNKLVYRLPHWRNVCPHPDPHPTVIRFKKCVNFQNFAQDNRGRQVIRLKCPRIKFRPKLPRKTSRRLYLCHECGAMLRLTKTPCM